MNPKRPCGDQAVLAITDSVELEEYTSAYAVAKLAKI
jgi:hypothetical protein